MDNQHKHIAGDRDLAPAEITLINDAKTLGRDLGEFIEHLERVAKANSGEMIDGRWLAIAKTDLQKGIMFLVRSIARPEGF